MKSNQLEQAMDAHRAGNLTEAEALYRAVVQSEPNHPDALALLGVVTGDKGNLAEAVRLIEQAIKLDPKAALFKFYLGNALMAAGDMKRAMVAFRQSIVLEPNMAQAHYNLGNALRAAELWDEAGAAYLKTLKLMPAHAEARNNLALVYEHQDRFADAVLALQQVVKDHPDYAEGWCNLCNLAEKNGDYELSLQAGKKATALAAYNPSVWLGMGVALNRLERHEEALGSYQTALKLRPDWVEVWDNLGQTYQFMNRLDEAEAAYRKTIELAGQVVEGEDTRRVDERGYGNRHWHLALLQLLKGDYKCGLARYRARFSEVGGLKRPPYPQPVWQGEDLNGKTILVTDEQGMGDCLMMARYLPLLKQRGARVKFLIHPVLVPLFEGWSGADEVIARGQPVVDFDYHASIFDLPYAFGTTLDTVPSKVPYLPLLSSDAATQLTGNDKTKVGVVWAGAPKHKHDARRSIPLKIFAALFATPNVEFFSINRDMRPGDTELLLQHSITDLAPNLNHFGDLGRFVNQMDLIITVDTATAHLAGGMGKLVWTLLPFAPDWRWLTARDDSPWYPTMRLFRQEKSGDWAGVINKVNQNLTGLLK